MVEQCGATHAGGFGDIAFNADSEKQAFCRECSAPPERTRFPKTGGSPEGIGYSPDLVLAPDNLLLFGWEIFFVLPVGLQAGGGLGGLVPQ
jgi:hypothetical protein